MLGKCILEKSPGFLFRRIILVLCIFCMIVPALTGCIFLPKEEEVLAPPLKVPESITYDTVDVAKGSIVNDVSVTASFVSVEQVNMSFEYGGGYLKDIKVNIGDKVKKGDTLAILDTEDLENRIKQQELAIKKLQLNYDRLKTEMDIQGGGDKYSLEQAQIDMEIASLQLDDLNTQRSRATLVSPISGVVDYISDQVAAGVRVEARQILMRIADVTKLQLSCDSGDITKFGLGMKVTVEYDDKEYDGKVVMTGQNVPLGEYERLQNVVRFSVAAIPEGVEIGSTARVTAILNQKDDVIVLQKSLVHNYLGRRFVNVLDNGVVSERDIETGLESATEYEIVKGLEVGEKIVR